MSLVRDIVILLLGVASGKCKALLVRDLSLVKGNVMVQQAENQ